MSLETRSAATATTTLAPKFDPLDPEVIADPYPHYARLRESAPVCRGGLGTWMVFRYEDVSALLSDQRLGNQRADSQGDSETPLFGAGPAGELSQRIIAGQDGPRHVALRKALSGQLSAARARQRREHVARLVDTLLEPARDGEAFDVVTQLAFPLQALVVCDLLGIAASERDRIWPRAMDLGRTFIPYRMPTAEVAAKADAAVAELRGHINTWLDARRGDPRDDLLSQIGAAMDKEGNGGALAGLSREELVDNLVFLLFAGFEPTMNMMANGFAALLGHPGEWDRLAADAGLVGSAVEEFLRYDAPTQYTMRIVREPIELHGRSIRPGRLLLLVLGSANRDERKFEHAHRLDLGRSPNPQLSFGGGSHHCTGWALARVEGEAVFGRVRELFTALEPAGEAVRLDHPNFRAHRALPVRLRSR